MAILEDGSPEWHELRSTGVGGSDAGVLLGLDPHKSPYVLYHEKAGIIPRPEIDEKYSKWGHRLEGPIREELQEQHDELWIMEVPGTYRNPAHPHLLVNIDGLAVDIETGELDSIVECKTSENGYGWGPAHSRDLADIPPKYVAQVMTYMLVTGIHMARICPLINTVNWREYVVHYDDVMAQKILVKSLQLMEQLAKAEVPPIDGWECTINLIREFNPSLDKKLEVDVPDKIAESWLAAREAFTKAEKEKLRWDGHMLAHLGTAAKGNYKGKPIAGRQAIGKGVPFLVAK